MATNWMTGLKEAGADADGVLQRLSGNISLYQMILRMFPQDETFKQIEPALQANDWAALRTERYLEALVSCAKIRDTHTEFIEIIRLLEEA